MYQLCNGVIYILAIISAGYLCDFFVRPIVDWMKNYAKGKSSDNKKSDFIAIYPELTRWLGIIERGMYVASWLLGFPQFIAFWLSFKVVGTWKDWTDPGQEARAKFLIFLIGSGISLSVSILIAIIAQYVLKV